MKVARRLVQRSLSRSKDVEQFYGKRFSGEEIKLNHNACTVVDGKYSKYLSNLHPDILAYDYGCGSPIPPYVEGLTVVDLGSGSGKDCFILSQLVGQEGNIIGVDMTEEALDLANSMIDYHTENFGYSEPNVRFEFGNIEELTMIEDDSVDLVVSNCVVNLAENKENVFSEVHRILKPGGEMYFSDVYCNMRVPEILQEQEDLWGECISGSLYMNDFESILEKVGFPGFRITEGRKIEIEESLYQMIQDSQEEEDGNFRLHPEFYSLTVRMFKTSVPEINEENYGQNATFLGFGDDEEETTFKFDSQTVFVKGQKQLVSNNTAWILENSRYPFEVEVEKVHRGRFRYEQKYWDVIDDIDEFGLTGACC